MLSYIQIISDQYPNVKCSCIGDGFDYDSIIWESGDPLPSKSDLDAAILAQTQNDIWNAIKAKRDEVRAGGVLVGGNWFHSDDSSRIQHIALVMAGANLPSGVQWKTMAGIFVTMTPTLAAQIFGAFLAKEPVIYAVAETHRVNMMASLTPETYDYSTGWPATYTE